jgi:uncharacterized protein YbjQ (UPF0145 family)
LKEVKFMTFVSIDVPAFLLGNSIPVLTINEVPGFPTIEAVGTAYVTIQNDRVFTSLEKSMQEGYDALADYAKSVGADAVVGLNFSTMSRGPSGYELSFIATMVKVQKPA